MNAEILGTIIQIVMGFLFTAIAVFVCFKSCKDCIEDDDII